MDTEKLCEFLLPLAESSDQLPPRRLHELLRLLQEGFVGAFKDTKPTNAPGSVEEAKLIIAKAVREFHLRGPRACPDLFTDPQYHQQAALFLHEFLQSLTGNSREWFRELQLECMTACSAVLDCIGVHNVRLCVPGVASATIRYVNRSHLGKDSAAVRHSALDVLHKALTVALSSEEEGEWVQDAVGHLANSMRGFLEPANIVENAYDEFSLWRIRRLTADVLSSAGMRAHRGSALARLLVVAYLVVENMLHLCSLEGDAAGTRGEVPTVLIDAEVLLSSPAALEEMRDATQQLNGVALLHLVSSLARLEPTRKVLVSADAGAVQVFRSVLKKCIRVVGTTLAPEDLYTARTPRRYPAGVVDECLESLAHALAAAAPDATGVTEDDSEETPGEQLTNLLLDECEGVLQDWDLYMVHPPTLYVLTRMVTWQFKPLPRRDLWYYSHCTSPEPADFVVSGAFEQLWSIVGVAHLWDITQDEELCNYQQIHHRQVVAATTLRFLSVAATTVLAHAVREGGPEGGRGFSRFTTLTLYMIMEKAAGSGIVHDAAIECIHQCFVASGRAKALDFFLEVGLHLIDEASRAVKEVSLRPATASVLRGAMEYAVAALSESKESTGEAGEQGSAPLLLQGSVSKLPLLVRHRMKKEEVAALCLRYRATGEREIGQLADFTAAAVQVAAGCCRLASEEGDARGTRAALALLRDSFDIAALLNFCSPLEGNDEEQDRETTSFNPRVRRVQEECKTALFAILTHCFASDASTPQAIQAVVRGLTSFLTTKSAERWGIAQVEEWNKAQGTKRAARQTAKDQRKDDIESVGEDSDGEETMPKPVSPPLPWRTTSSPSAGHQSEAPAEDGDTIVLLRSHLKTVYRVYLCFVALLKEPVSRFLTANSRPWHRGGEERRQLESVAATPAFFATLSGLEALTTLSTEFLEHRMVEEVLPVALVWYEKAALPRIPTNTDERVKQAVRQFATTLAQLCSTTQLRESVQEKVDAVLHSASRKDNAPTHVAPAVSFNNVSPTSS